MKFLNVFLTAVPAVLLSVVGSVAQTSDQVITAIQSLTEAARTLDIQVTGLTVINFPTEGLIIASGLNNITEEVNTFNAEFSPTTPPYPDDAAVMVVDVLATFVTLYEWDFKLFPLLYLLFLTTTPPDDPTHRPLAAMFGIVAPIAAALRGLAITVEDFAFDLIGLIPTEADTATALIRAPYRSTTCNVTYDLP
ncbi:hypothetical protein GSI_14243 [Ganoderma sinense ZZ0214-1]|uniref:Transporter n=1 Tax=Ganoderma sinense ZZ0214-1 TaxID=1077348 RepID=A0A2G8RT15_9APHY|nr:hypothetical protein GSI_14243 [Ganoderma sinense ZZ0214-1]